MAKKRLLMIVGDFVEDYEAMAPFQMLTMVGHQVDSACTDGNLIAAPVWPAHPAWIRELLRTLGTPVSAARLRIVAKCRIEAAWAGK